MVIRTEKLFLKSLNIQDAQNIFEIRSNLEINQYLHRDPPKNTFEALDLILSIKRKSENSEIVFFGISLQNHPKLIGTICLWKFSEDRKTAELGYELLPQFQEKGIMFEAVHSVLNYGFNDLNLNKIEAFTNKENFNSVKLLQKSKFVLNEKRKDDKYPENLIFELNNVK